MVLASSTNPASLLSSTVTPPPTSSSSRAGRLRRLTYLRSVTHSDFRPQSPDLSPSRSNRPSLHRSGSVETTNSHSRFRGGQQASTEPGSPTPTSSALPTPSASTNLRHPAQTHQESSPNHESSSREATMTRRRSATIPSAAPAPPPRATTTTRGPSTYASESPSTNVPPSTRQTVSRSTQSQLPSIRFVPYQDSRSSRPSLSFPTISRTLPNTDSIIRVGRYSEKDSPPEAVGDAPSDAAVGFKSKVVSRKHCEFLYQDSHWWIKDVKSSSGTFLNHIRLSQPGVESRPYKIKDGDIVQLGIDFKGGEESIFRCVKIRILCNRGWQQGLNNFNTSAHKQLQQLTKNNQMRSTDSTSRDSTDCTICLSAIGPCQSLFIAPCSHTWHYKCIRPIIMQHGEFRYPQFLCPNCRAVADLEEDIEEPASWEEAESVEDQASAQAVPAGEQTQRQLNDGNFDHETSEHTEEDDDLAVEMANATLQDVPSQHRLQPPTSESDVDESSSSDQEHDSNDPSDPSHLGTSPRGLNPDASTFIPASTAAIPIPSSSRPSSFGQQPHHPADDDETGGSADDEAAASIYPLTAVRTVTTGSVPFMLAPDVQGPMTPRNDAGPFVFDGGAGDREDGRRGVLGSLNKMARVS